MKNCKNIILGIILIVVGVWFGLYATGVVKINLLFDGWWVYGPRADRVCTLNVIALLNRRNIKSPLMSISLTNKNIANAKITMPSTYSSGPSILMLYQMKNGWLL